MSLSQSDDDTPWPYGHDEGDQGEPSGGDDPDLGEDVLAIRLRAARLSAKRGAATETGAKEAVPEQRAGSFGAPSLHGGQPGFAQIDLNSREQGVTVEGLEDPGLMAHMRRRREAAAVEEEQASQLPSLPQVRKEDQKARQALSSLAVSLKDRQMEFRCLCEEVFLGSENATRLANGEVPHGYPPDGKASLADRCRLLGQKLRKTGDSFAATLLALEQLEADLVLARRGHDLASTSLLRLAGAATPE